MFWSISTNLFSKLDCFQGAPFSEKWKRMFTITEWSNFQELVRKFTPRKGFIQETIA